MPSGQPSFFRRELFRTSHVTPIESAITSAYCALTLTTLVFCAPRDSRLIAVASSGNVTPVACSAITIALTSAPRTSAMTDERFTDKLLSMILRGRKRIVRADDQLAEELVRRIDCLATENEAGLAGVLLHQAQAELIILEQMRA